MVSYDAENWMDCLWPYLKIEMSKSASGSTRESTRQNKAWSVCARARRKKNGRINILRDKANCSSFDSTDRVRAQDSRLSVYQFVERQIVRHNQIAYQTCQG